MSEKINELETNSNNKNVRNIYRRINEFMKCYQPRTNIIEHNNSDVNEFFIIF